MGSWIARYLVLRSPLRAFVTKRLSGRSGDVYDHLANAYDARGVKHVLV